MITPAFNLTATERVLPKLALDFTTATLDPRITFTRAGNTATRVNSSGFVELANADVARFDFNPVTLACNGLLIEETRTNQILNSANVFAASWTQSKVTSGSSITAPDNTTSAAKLIESSDVSNSVHYVEQYVSVTSGSTYTLSIFIKKGERISARLRLLGDFTDTFANFDVNTGVVQSGNGVIQNYGNGWYRCSITAVANATSANGRIIIYLNNSLGNNQYIGNGTSGMYFWGAQVETGAFATSYIPTTTTALTRNADVATMTGTNFSDWFNATEGAAVVQVLPSVVSGTRPVIEFDDNTANQAIVLRGVAADPQLFVVNGGAAQATLDAGTITANTAYKLGGAWKSASFAASVNGGATVSQLSGTHPTTTQARLGSDGVNFFNGCLQNLRYWPQRITNAETQAFSK